MDIWVSPFAWSSSVQNVKKRSFLGKVGWIVYMTECNPKYALADLLFFRYLSRISQEIRDSFDLR